MAGRTRSGVTLAAAPAPPITSDGVQTRTQAAGLRGIRSLPQLGARGYLYLVVLLELAAIAGLRHIFRNHHGG